MALDRITALAARLFAVTIAIGSVVDHDRIWFKSHHGIQISQVDRDPGLCASAILQDEPWIIRDATADTRALSNPLVADGFGLQFYAGVPLRTRDGYNLGTICVLDRQPRIPTDPMPLSPLAKMLMETQPVSALVLSVLGALARTSSTLSALRPDRGLPGGFVGTGSA
jgi:GAF domain-containing protein